MTQPDIFDSPRWWLALRRDERQPQQLPDDPRTRQKGKRRLDSWTEDRHITGGLPVDLSRWVDDCGEDPLLCMLGETATSLRARLPRRPEWLDTLKVAWTWRPGASPNAEPAEAAESLLEWVRPIIDHHREQLRQHVAGAAVPPIDHSHPLMRLPELSLLSMVSPVLADVLGRARAAGELDGRTGVERFGAFVARLRDRDRSIRLLLEYPVLAREIVESLQAWVRVRAELVARLAGDLPLLREELGITATDLTDVAEVDYGVGDSHRGGRSVAIITFTDGTRLVYKPRSLSVERHFFALVEWLNRRGLRHPLRRLRVLSRDRYGWAEFVPAGACADDAALRRFYWRQGAYLALLHTLRISDIHMENLIAAGEHPVVVDLEAAFQQPSAPNGRAPALVPQAMRLMAESVLGVGLLPQRAMRHDGRTVRGVDMSGLSGAGGELSPMALPQWLDSGTDMMRRERRPVPTQPAHNMPTMRGRTTGPLAYQDDFLNGFQSCYLLLHKHRDELLAAGGPLDSFAQAETRFLVQPTMVYGRVLAESWHPLVLRDSLERECLLEVVGARHPHLARSEQITASECRQVAGRDIPYFWTSPGSRHLHDDDGRLAADYFPRTGLQLVRDRVRGLGPADLRRQIWTVQASLTGLRIGDAVSDYAPRRRVLPGAELDGPLALKAAAIIGDRLLDSAFNDSEPPMWLTLTLAADRYWTVVPAGFDIYGGIGGIALFLAELDAGILAAGGTRAPTRYRRAARTIADMLVDHLEGMASPRGEARDNLAIGGFMDLGSHLYVLARLGAMWGERRLLAGAHELVPQITQRLPGDRNLDVMFGAAGAALALRCLHAADPTPGTAAALHAAGDHLLALAVPQATGIAWDTAIGSRAPLLGFSHGCSGIAYALTEIGRVTGQERFTAAAAQAIQHEHSQYEKASGSWPDHREHSAPGASMNAWCHGAAGIGLARAAVADLLDGQDVHADLHAAAAAVQRDLVDGGQLTGVGNDCLCHGDLGLAETLLSAGLACADPAMVALARQCGRSVAEAVLSGKEKCGVPQGVYIPGLLMGAAGVGYGLLRLADPGRVPNVLLLEPPSSTAPAP